MKQSYLYLEGKRFIYHFSSICMSFLVMLLLAALWAVTPVVFSELQCALLFFVASLVGFRLLDPFAQQVILLRKGDVLRPDKVFSALAWMFGFQLVTLLLIESFCVLSLTLFQGVEWHFALFLQTAYLSIAMVLLAVNRFLRFFQLFLPFVVRVLLYVSVVIPLGFLFSVPLETLLGGTFSNFDVLPLLSVSTLITILVLFFIYQISQFWSV